MKFKKIVLMAAAAGFIAQATPVLADNHGDHGNKGKMFEKHDTNGDGQISEAEFLEHAKKKFASKDTNGDGSISKDEAKAAKKEKREKMKEKRKERKENKSAE